MPPKKQTGATATKRAATTKSAPKKAESGEDNSDGEMSDDSVHDKKSKIKDEVPSGRPRRAAASVAAKKIKLDGDGDGDSDRSGGKAASRRKPAAKREVSKKAVKIGGKGDNASKSKRKAPAAKKSKNGSSAKDEEDSEDNLSEDDISEEEVVPKKKKAAAKPAPKKAKAVAGKAKNGKSKAKSEDEDDESEKEEDEVDEKSEESEEEAKAAPVKKAAAKPVAAKKAKPAGKGKAKSKEDSESEVDEKDEEEEESKAANSKKPIKVAPAKPAAAKKPKVEKKLKEDEDDDEDDEEVAPKEEEEKEAATAGEAKNVRTLIIKGKAPVDPLCSSMLDKAHVYCEGNDVYDAMLNQTNLQFNNNKYYLLQLLEDDRSSNYSLWLRWGRVGKDGQNKLESHGSNLQKAKNSFMKKFEDKTKYNWENRHSFVKVSGKYDLLQMDYSTDTDLVKDEVDTKSKKAKDIPESKLDKNIQSLIQLICNVRAMEQAVIEMQFDTDKSPLGKLTTDQIKAGYLALKTIEELVNKGKRSGTKLVQACNDFYTRIPHSFGMKTPPLIDSLDAIKRKIDLLEALGDIQVAIKMLNSAKHEPENPLDNQYKGLDCHLTTLARHSETFKILETYLSNSHEKTHNMYQLKIVNIFQCEKESEKDAFVNYGKRMLLWHGSRLTNWAGILKQGLRIAPPEAPVTGYMFGKGIYFADRSSKSANYCCTTRSNNTGLLLLCEVSLGDCNELTQANFEADRLPQGKNSVKGMGSNVPTETENVTLPDGTIVPLGKSCTNKGDKNYSLLYNEYIVYRREQIKMRFLMEVKFIYK